MSTYMYVDGTLVQCTKIRIWLRIIGQILGIREGISGNFLKELLEVFEELSAHAYQALPVMTGRSLGMRLPHNTFATGNNS